MTHINLTSDHTARRLYCYEDKDEPLGKFTCFSGICLDKTKSSDVDQLK